MSTNQNTNEEEVDLGYLFKIIGKGFSNFFNFIGKFLKEIFHGIIVSLIFLKEHIIKIGIAAIIGASFGVYLELNKKTLYASSFLVEPNFKSTRQLYNNIDYYNELVQQKNYAELSKTFGIEESLVTSLKSFSIETIKNDKDIISRYDEFVLDADSITVKKYTYKEFKSSFSKYDYKVHKINVIAYRNDVFKHLGSPIIASVVDNKYFSRYKKLANENLNRTELLLRKNLIQLDSLSETYRAVLLQKSQKVTAGTNIDLGSRGNKIKELELFETKKDINEDLEAIVEEKTNKYEVVNVISSFQPVGYRIKGVTKNYISLLALLGALTVIVVLLLFKLNKYLDTYKK